MSLIQKGNPTTANKHQPSGTIAYSGSIAGAWFVDFISPGDVGVSSYNLLSSHDNQSSGLRVFLTGTQIRATWRCNSYNTNVTISSGLTAGTRYRVWGRISLTDDTLRYFLDGSEVGSAIDMSASTSFFSTSAAQPFIGGIATDGLDIEVFEAAIWFGSSDAAIPSAAQILAYTNGDNLSAMSPAPKIGTLCNGTNGAYASSLTDYIGSNNWLHVAGDIDDSNGNQPRFAGAISQLSAQTSTITATKATLGATTSVTSGTYYFVGDDASNWGGTPTGAQIEAGKLDDNTTDAEITYSASVSGSSISRQFTGLRALDGYVFHLVQKFVDTTYSNVLTYTFTTKKPVLEPAGTNKALYLSNGDLAVSETGIELKFIGSTYSENDLATDVNGLLEIDLTDARNSGGISLDIGDTISLALIFSNGDTIFADDQTIIEGT